LITFSLPDVTQALYLLKQSGDTRSILDLMLYPPPFLAPMGSGSLDGTDDISGFGSDPILPLWVDGRTDRGRFPSLLW